MFYSVVTNALFICRAEKLVETSVQIAQFAVVRILDNHHGYAEDDAATGTNMCKLSHFGERGLSAFRKHNLFVFL